MIILQRYSFHLKYATFSCQKEYVKQEFSKICKKVGLRLSTKRIKYLSLYRFMGRVSLCPINMIVIIHIIYYS